MCIPAANLFMLYLVKEYPLTSRDALDTIVSNAKRWNSVPTDDIVKVVCLSPDLVGVNLFGSILLTFILLFYSSTRTNRKS